MRAYCANNGCASPSEWRPPAMCAQQGASCRITARDANLSAREPKSKPEGLNPEP